MHLENDDPVSEDPFFIVKVIDKVGSPWLRALPDFGNTVVAHDEDYAYRAIDEMFAHAYGICHVKDGEENEEGKNGSRGPGTHLFHPQEARIQRLLLDGI